MQGIPSLSSTVALRGLNSRNPRNLVITDKDKILEINMDDISYRFASSEFFDSRPLELDQAVYQAVSEIGSHVVNRMMAGKPYSLKHGGILIQTSVRSPFIQNEVPRR